MPEHNDTKTADEINVPTEPANPLAPDPSPAAANAPEPKGKDAPKFVVYLGGDAYPPPSNHPSGLWSQKEWDERDDAVAYFRVDDSGKLEE